MALPILDCSKKPVKRGWTLFAIAWIIISIILISVSLKKLSTTEYGVEYDRWKKTLDDAAKSGGLHNGPPGYRFVKFPSTQISVNLADTCVSRDGLRVNYEVTFQYSLQANHITEVVRKYKDFKTWAVIVEAAGTSAVQHSCSNFNVTNFQGLRNQIQTHMYDKVKSKFTSIRAEANSLQLSNVNLPVQYKDAISEKQRAEEDIALAINQRNQETTKANTELLAASQEATRLMDNAYNTGNVTITQAYFKANETAFAFEKEKEVLLQAKINFNLDNNGVLAYMTNQLYETTEGLSASFGEPAIISRKDEL